MICFTKLVLTEDLYILERRNFNLHVIYATRPLDERPSIFISNKPIFSSERMLEKDYDLKDSVEKIISGRESQGA
jgi:hypothetical protein